MVEASVPVGTGRQPSLQRHAGTTRKQIHESGTLTPSKSVIVANFIIPATSRVLSTTGIVMAKKKKIVRREYTQADVKALRAHSKAKTPIAKIAKTMKRTVGSLRMKAHNLGISLGHRR
jgi:uncharacterized protein (DUF362 family)